VHSAKRTTRPFALAPRSAGPFEAAPSRATYGRCTMNGSQSWCTHASTGAPILAASLCERETPEKCYGEDRTACALPSSLWTRAECASRRAVGADSRTLWAGSKNAALLRIDRPSLPTPGASEVSGDNPSSHPRSDVPPDPTRGPCPTAKGTCSHLGLANLLHQEDDLTVPPQESAESRGVLPRPSHLPRLSRLRAAALEHRRGSGTRIPGSELNHNSRRRDREAHGPASSRAQPWPRRDPRRRSVSPFAHWRARSRRRPLPRSFARVAGGSANGVRADSPRQEPRERPGQPESSPPWRREPLNLRSMERPDRNCRRSWLCPGSTLLWR